MLTINDIAKFYSPREQQMQRNIFREYLQYHMLNAIAQSPMANKLSFLGGTALRVVYGNPRFSEDLDFDNFGLTQEEFDGLSHVVKHFLELEGYAVEIQLAGKNAFRCNVRFPKILFENKLSPLRDEKVLIQIDSTAHNFDYEPSVVPLAKIGFGFTTRVTPLTLIFAQKIYAVFNRPRMLGRDFFDITFIAAQRVKPNYQYLQAKMGIENGTQLREKIAKKIQGMDFTKLTEDLHAYVYDEGQLQRVEHFPLFWEKVEL